MTRIETKDGFELYVEAHGEGPPLLLSVGYCQTHENFRPQVEPLVAAGYRVVLWDYRGHGRSDSPESLDAYSIDHVVDDMGRVLEWAAPGEPAILGGLSFGGLASLHFTLSHPERVKALLLFSSGPGFKKPEAQAGWEAQVGRIADRLEKIGFEGFTTGRSGATSIGRRPELPEAQAAGRAIQAQDPAGVARFGRRVSGPAPGVIDELQRIQQPTLVLVGENDNAYLRAAEVMAAKLPNSRHVVVPDAGHVSNIEQRERFNEAVIGFLRESLPGG
ncbi:MAG: alpha/beta hydrolase [Myxococcota bacterium]|nr:alpha/beta hydrolase [Myxococcota bacterium]